MLRILALLATFLAPITADAATRYWVGGGSSDAWGATGNTNWSATSGGANNASVPVSGDDVVFDANSGSGTVSLNSSQTISSFDSTNFSGTITHSTGTWTIDNATGAGLFKFGSSVTYSNGGGFTSFTNTSGTIDVTMAGETFGAVTINAPGGTVRLQDAFASGILTFTAGTFNANNNSLTLRTLISNNSNVRTLTMGSGTWTISYPGAGAAVWELATTNLTFNKDTANIVLSVTGNATASFFGGGLTYNGLTLSSPSSGTIFKSQFNGTNTFSSLSIGAGVQVVFGANQTVTSAPTISGTIARPVSISSDSQSQRNLSVSSGTVTCTYCVLSAINGTGGATFSAPSSYDLGNNSGWTITAPSAGGAHVVGG